MHTTNPPSKIFVGKFKEKNYEELKKAQEEAIKKVQLMYPDLKYVETKVSKKLDSISVWLLNFEEYKKIILF